MVSLTDSSGSMGTLGGTPDAACHCRAQHRVSRHRFRTTTARFVG